MTFDLVSDVQIQTVHPLQVQNPSYLLYLFDSKGFG